MCRCTLGTPAGISQQANEAQRNAKLTFQMWQNQGQLFMPREQLSVDIALPTLLRKTISEPTVMPLPSGKLLKLYPNSLTPPWAGACGSQAEGSCALYLLPCPEITRISQD